jgi:hypothetical protein
VQGGIFYLVPRRFSGLAGYKPPSLGRPVSQRDPKNASEKARVRLGRSLDSHATPWRLSDCTTPDETGLRSADAIPFFESLNAFEEKNGTSHHIIEEITISYDNEKSSVNVKWHPLLDAI